MHEESGQVESTWWTASVEATSLELPGQVVNALHMIALHLFILYQHRIRTWS
jgi:hypothetical protein